MDVGALYNCSHSPPPIIQEPPPPNSRVRQEIQANYKIYIYSYIVSLRFGKKERKQKTERSKGCSWQVIEVAFGPIWRLDWLVLFLLDDLTAGTL